MRVATAAFKQLLLEIGFEEAQLREVGLDVFLDDCVHELLDVVILDFSEDFVVTDHLFKLFSHGKLLHLAFFHPLHFLLLVLLGDELLEDLLQALNLAVLPALDEQVDNGVFEGKQVGCGILALLCVERPILEIVEADGAAYVVERLLVATLQRSRLSLLLNELLSKGRVLARNLDHARILQVVKGSAHVEAHVDRVLALHQEVMRVQDAACFQVLYRKLCPRVHCQVQLDLAFENDNEFV